MERRGLTNIAVRKTQRFCVGYPSVVRAVLALPPSPAYLLRLTSILLLCLVAAGHGQERLPDDKTWVASAAFLPEQAAIGSVRPIAFEAVADFDKLTSELTEGVRSDPEAERIEPVPEQPPDPWIGKPLAAECYPAEARWYWDNIEGAPYWLSGCAPKLRLGLGMHLVELSPKAHTRLLIPSNAVLRIVNPQGKLSPADLNVWVSDGTGVSRLHRPGVSERGHSLMVAAGDSRPSIVIVERPKQAACSLGLAFFVSRTELPTATSPGCPPVLEGCERVKVTRRRDHSIQEFLRVKPQRFHKLAGGLNGQLVIETRLEYPAWESKRHQVYQLLVKFDGRPIRVIDFETVVESREELLINGCVSILGRMQIDHLCIPPGVKQVQIGSTADVLVRIRACSGCACDINNGPRGPCGPACLASSFPWPGRTSIWDLNPLEIQSSIQTGSDTCFPIAALHRVARDNRYRGGGLSSLMLARAQTARWSQEPNWRQLSQRIEGMHTHYQHLLPSERGADRSQHFAWFHARKLKRLEASHRPQVVARQLVDATLNQGLSSGFFSAVPHQPEQALVYGLPTEDAPTLLRLAFDRRRIKQPVTLYVQLNDREPVTLRVEQGQDLPTMHYEPTLGETALAGLHGMHGSADGGTMGGPFGQGRTPSVFLPAGTATLLVPRDTQVVRIWSCNQSDLSVAAQVRKSRPFKLSERLYLELAAREKLGSESFWFNVSNPQEATDASFAAQELRNHWQPLLRLLRSHERRFVGSVRKPDQTDLVTRLPSPDVATWSTKARAAANRQDWIQAVEWWSRVLAEGIGSPRQQAAWGLLESLLAQGEHNLAERTARGLYLYDEDASVRADAHQFLLQRYLDQEDKLALEELTATAVIREGGVDRRLELAQALFDNARFDYAMLVGTSLPKGARPLELLVRCAYQQRWWGTFQQLVSMLPSLPQRNFWQAQMLVHQGEYDAALSLFRQAGPPGHEFAKSLSDGRRILGMLRHRDVTTRAQGILEWEVWSQHHPGPFVWREDGTHVAASRGGNLLYSVDRDAAARYYRSTPTEPVVLIVNGPARIELTARPRHPAESNQPLDDWLNVRLAGQHYVFPITSNRKSNSLTIIGDPGHQPGQAVREPIHVGPGRHRLLVHADHAELFVQAHVERPEWPLPILPPINRVTVDAALAGNLHVKSDHGLQARGSLIGSKCDACELEYVIACPDTGLNADRLLAGVSSELAARMAIRIAGNVDWYRTAIAELALNSAQLAPLERLLAFERAGIMDASASAVLGETAQLPGAVADAFRMHRNVPPDFTSPLNSRSDVIRRAVLLAYTAEHIPARRDELSLLARQLGVEHPDVQPLQALTSRLSWPLHWERREQVDRSAGISSRRVERWEPESPSLRNRLALAKDLLPTEHVLLGPDTLVLATREAQPASLEMSLRMLEIGYTPEAPALVAIELDGAAHATMEVLPGQVSQMSLDLTDGHHALGWRLVDPKLGQMVRLAVKVRRRGSQLTEDIGPDVERLYHVATDAEPIELEVQGPALLRVDQRIGDATSSRYRHVAAGSESIVLTPSEGQDRAMFRIFELIPDPEGERTYPLHVTVTPEPVPRPLIGSIDLPTETNGFGDVQLASYQQPDDVGGLALVPADSDHVVVDDVDRQVLGAQEDGTWDLGVGWYDRQLIEEAPGSIGVDRFLEFHGTHRIYWQYKDVYLRNEFLLRTRNSNAATVGYRHRGWWEVDNSAWDVGWNASTFTQKPIPNNSRVPREQEWILGGGIEFNRYSYLAPCWHHTPIVSFFGRSVELDFNPYGPGRIDQDIFTRYKRDHRYGWRITDRLVWEQYEDRRWWVAPYAASNEDLSVDHYGARTGVQQAIGRFDFDLSYRFTRFLADGDRPIDVNQHLLFLDAHLHRWNVLGRRVEVSTRWRQGLSDGRSSFNIVLSWYFDRGRQYRDFHPNEHRFHELRSQFAEYANSPWLVE